MSSRNHRIDILQGWTKRGRWSIAIRNSGDPVFLANFIRPITLLDTKSQGNSRNLQSYQKIFVHLMGYYILLLLIYSWLYFVLHI